jgi:hypothetical protein
MSRSLFLVIFALITSQCIARDIPLAEITSNRHQEGLKHIGSGIRFDGSKTVEEDYASAMNRLLGSTGGASNVLLVDAGSINDAVKASSRVLAGLRAADKPTAPILSHNHWLVAYLGVSGSGPPKWVVDSVSVDGNTIRLTYRKIRNAGHTTDVAFYYYWVPIGALENGVYNLELYDSGLKSVTLMRRVEIGKEL